MEKRTEQMASEIASLRDTLEKLVTQMAAKWTCIGFAINSCFSFCFWVDFQFFSFFFLACQFEQLVWFTEHRIVTVSFRIWHFVSLLQCRFGDYWFKLQIYIVKWILSCLYGQFWIIVFWQATQHLIGTLCSLYIWLNAFLWKTL